MRKLHPTGQCQLRPHPKEVPILYCSDSIFLCGHGRRKNLLAPKPGGMKALATEIPHVPAQLPMPYSPRAWMGGQGDVLEHSRGPLPQHLQPEHAGDGAAEPRPGVPRPPQHLRVSQPPKRLSSPHLCGVLPHFTTPRVRHFQERSDV